MVCQYSYIDGDRLAPLAAGGRFLKHVKTWHQSKKLIRNKNRSGKKADRIKGRADPGV